MNLIRHFDLELADLKRSLMTMSNLVERSLIVAIEAILHPNTTARETCSAIEKELDDLENAIEDRCHNIIALQQPMANELRLVIAAMRITSDLEQIGDLSESLAKRGAFIASHSGAVIPEELSPLCALVQKMQRQAMDAFVSGDLSIADMIVTEEKTTDDQTKACYKAIQKLMVDNPERIQEYTHLLRAASLLEHIADVITSIADETVYLYKGVISRHQH
jgi:phosphate transport system protein